MTALKNGIFEVVQNEGFLAEILSNRKIFRIKIECFLFFETIYFRFM
jgi:hypothetical protein